jgi:hypothetical protein
VITQGNPESRIIYFTANPNGEAEIIRIALKPGCGARKLIFERDFSEISIKGKSARGVTLTKHPVLRVSLKSHGISTLGGRKVWFDRDVLRLNYDERGKYLGEFQAEDQILVVLNDGTYYTTDFELSNHYEDNVVVLEKFDSEKIWTAVLYDADQQNYPYLKRFYFEASTKKQNYLGENPKSLPVILSSQVYSRIKVTFGGADDFRAPLEIEATDFIGIKGIKAKGKRLTTFTVGEITELEPTRQPEISEERDEEDEEFSDTEEEDLDDDKSDNDIIDELTGQGKLF